jgi:hypothetical protein
MKSFKIKITGTNPLMLNNPQTVNPFNEYSKMLSPLTSKRKKTEDDLIEISKIKFLSSLYVNDGVYIIPSSHFEQSVIEAAKEVKLGKKFERNFRIFSDGILDFPDKDKTPQQLYEIGTYVDVRAVGIKNVKITTTRAIFPKWSTEVECFFDETQINDDDVINVLKTAGLRYGIGTYRKLYGRYKVEIIK